jgi:class 3 adenylate cyclase/tetratricopeptide (TPR) repeat protein
VTPLRCAVCGTPTVATARFCFACGVPLESSPESAEPAERRVVTVLFGDLSDFTGWAEDLDPERVGEVTDRVLAALARAVADVGGHVDKLTGDGIMAVFGAPTAHEDDAERAVRAAAAMQSAVRRLMEDEAGGGRRLGLRVGLNTGEVLAGVQAALAYTVVGDTVNTASRLADAAGIGAVYAGRETAVATMHVASWRALTPLRLKGKRQPVPAYELVGLRAEGGGRLGLGDEAPLIGRDAELGVLIGRVLDVADRCRPATVLVTGEAGVGKTRVVQEVTRFAGELPGARVLWGRCPPFGESRPLAPLADLVRMACGIGEGDEPAEAVDRLRRTVARLERLGGAARVPGSLAERLVALLDLEPPSQAPSLRDGAGPGPEVGMAGNRDIGLEAAAQLLRALATEGLLVLVVDDLQWAGPALLAALQVVGARLDGPVLLVGSGRSDLLVGDWWRELPDPEIVPLGPLEDAAAERLLRAYLDGAGLDPRARRALIERARGNPFFLAELLHLLVDQGLLRRDGASWRLAGDLPDGVLPAGVQAVLAARIDALDPAAKAVLRDAAVLGTQFPAPAVAALGSRPVDALHPALDELLARQLLKAPEVGENTYTFVHPMARDVAYAGLAKSERARRHAAAAAWGREALTGAGADEFVAGQAQQAVDLAASMGLASGDPAWQARELGRQALLRLGEAALARDEHRRAEKLLARALSGLADEPPGGGDATVLVAYAEALASLRRLADAERALTVPLASDRPRIRARALSVLGDIRHKQGREAEAAEALVRALAVAGDAGLDQIAGPALRQLGLLDHHAGRLRSAEQRFRDALELARRVADGRGAGWALQHLAWSATTRGAYDVAERALGEATAVFGDLDDTEGLAWCAGTEALLRVLQGQLLAARASTSSLLDLAEGMGAQWGVAACLTIDAIAAAELGELTVAEEHGGRAYALFDGFDDAWGRSMALVGQAMAARAAADPARGLALLRRATQLADTRTHPLTGAFAQVTLGLTALDAGYVDEAEAAADTAIRALDGMELEPSALLGARVLCAQVQRARGNVEEAVKLLREALAREEGPSLLFPRRQALAHLAGTLLSAGRAEEALQVARRAVAEPAEDVRSRVVALRALGSALAAAARPDEARATLEEALAVATSTEARSEVAACRRLLAAFPA